MRLSNRIKDLIKTNIQLVYGDVDIYLFGSRIDDTKKGGDIDIAIDVNLSKEDFRSKKAKFLSNLLRSGYELSIDLVPFHTKDQLLFLEIQKNHKKL